ncbi:hypothetical protein M426DRAFT_325624 [Hypoxylon sp. CI-4A]|nr:hypothetical protein M426DRAFT_325624 [Hypoxylon sp. CI-4A]
MNMYGEQKSFLDLPADIRRRIYRDAGLLVGTHILLRSGSKSDYPLCLAPKAQYQFTYNLLQICKSVYVEAKSIICEENKLIVSHHNIEGGLEFLRGLSPQECSKLRDIYVHLHVTRPFHDEDGKWWRPSAAPLSRSQIEAWQRAAAHVLSHAGSRRLNLHLVCDMNDDDNNESMIGDVLEPLLNHADAIGECELRLHPKRHGWISKLAEETAARVKGLDASSRSQPFRFLDLPTEIRHKILEYTDLVTPHNQAQWNSERGFYVDRRQDYCASSMCDNPELESGTGKPSKGPGITGSFCCARHSGYSPRCKCWAPSQALMLVSRGMYVDACHVFYSRNRIIVTPSGGVPTGISSRVPPMRLDASKFITGHMWPEVLYHLRCLEIVLPPLDPDMFPTESSSLYQDWALAIDQLSRNVNVNNLTITVHITMFGSLRGRNRAQSQEISWPEPDIEFMIRTFARLLAPLQTLREMNRLFVHLVWPWNWLSGAYMPQDRLKSRSGTNVTRRIEEIEASLENSVMGAEYDSATKGKAAETPNMQLYEIDCC